MSGTQVAARWGFPPPWASQHGCGRLLGSGLRPEAGTLGRARSGARARRNSQSGKMAGGQVLLSLAPWSLSLGTLSASESGMMTWKREPRDSDLEKHSGLGRLERSSADKAAPGGKGETEVRRRWVTGKCTELVFPGV